VKGGICVYTIFSLSTGGRVDPRHESMGAVNSLDSARHGN
jgi:hypothetical protein